jgi:hypothetical protein
MIFFSIPDWDDLQHYKDRSPPWIKLHNKLLDDYNFSCLQDASKAHLMCIYMLASRTENKLPYDTDWITNKIGAKTKVDLKELLDAGFIITDTPVESEKTDTKQQVISMEQNASKALHNTAQDACLEERRGEQSRAEGEHKKNSSRFVKPTTDEINQYLIEKGINDFSYAEKIWHFYESKGWVVGKTKMKIWKSAISANWIQTYKPVLNSQGGELQSISEIYKTNDQEQFIDQQGSGLLIDQIPGDNHD